MDHLLTPPNPKKVKGPQGIGGWLILPAIGLILGPILICISFSEFLSEEVQQAARESASIAAYVNVVLGGQVVLLLILIVTGLLFFSKNKAAPNFYIFLLVAGVVFSIVSYVVGTDTGIKEVTEEDLRGIRRSISGAMIWIPYFLVSKRVKNTFVAKEEKYDFLNASIEEFRREEASLQNPLSLNDD